MTWNRTFTPITLNWLSVITMNGLSWKAILCMTVRVFQKLRRLTSICNFLIKSARGEKNKNKTATASVFFKRTRRVNNKIHSRSKRLSPQRLFTHFQTDQRWVEFDVIHCLPDYRNQTPLWMQDHKGIFNVPQQWRYAFRTLLESCVCNVIVHIIHTPKKEITVLHLDLHLQEVMR